METHMNVDAFLLFAGKQCLLFLLLLLLLHALILFSTTSAAIAAALDNSTDLSSLLAFKASTTTTSGGDASSDNINIAANWTTDAPFCTRVGVRCSRRRPRVVFLDLSSFSLQEYGSTRGVTIRGDVYSFGILLLELVTGKKPIDTMFSGELNMRQWVCNAYPTAVMEIVDSNILRTEFTNLQQHSDGVNILHRCLSSIIEVGLHCSKDLPNERLLMRDVVPKLQEIKKGVLVNQKKASSCAHQNRCHIHATCIMLDK
ncbi:putative LRR receptor-like serine/threonine-protein kinase [Iris pallida]|uniref:LRR receptor-like serine/threonine-protein kinase n=1 Tax=Iris pallida TaxID=29817 RepID=A0AAX6J090_IRIPA|nr:putative LRR receptor-like serine/threonine-protein kinase [Iris pallida]